MSVTKVVILNWNGSHHLRTFLPSVVQNTPLDVEIIVVDNGSTDNSLAVLKEEFRSVSVLSLKANYGFAGGYNIAVQVIKADYLVLLNSDVQTPQGWLEPLVETLDKDESLGAVAPKLLSYADKSEFEYAGASGGYLDLFGYPFCRGRILRTLEKDQGQYDDKTKVFWASGACLCIRRSVFDKLKGFDAKFFAHMEEIDLCWRMQLEGYGVAVEPRSEVYHLGGGTLSEDSPRKLFFNFRNNLAMLYKNLPSSRLHLVLFVRMLLDGLAAFVYLLKGKRANFNAVLAAHSAFYEWKGGLKKQRKQIQERAKADVEGYYAGSILLRYALGNKSFQGIRIGKIINKRKTKN